MSLRMLAKDESGNPDNVRPLRPELRQERLPPAQVLAVVGHELRNPVAALLVSAELVAEGLDEFDRQQLADLLTRIQQRARGLQVLVDNLMFSATGYVSLRCEPLVAGELASDVRLTVEPLLARKHQRLQVRGSAIQLVADRARFTQVLVNLILNASKFSPAHARIRLEFMARGSGIGIEVTDRGIGLPAGSTEWLFEPTARADHDSAGLGLGLAIVRSIVEAHGGRVGAMNRAGGGARFWITLPRVDEFQPDIAGPISRHEPERRIRAAHPYRR